jgi:transmembrane sensor
VLPESIRVIASTLRSQSLPDGSVAELNGASRIEVHYTAGERRVRLLGGEAHFVVAKDPARPFFVSAGPVTVRAVGTAFNVRFAPVAIEVLVTEGRVQVETAAAPAETAPPVAPVPALVAGQRARIDAQGVGAGAVEIGDVGRPGIDEALGWQGTRLVFNGTDLEAVVAAFNRYNRHRLILGDPGLRRRALTGTFRADNLEGFLRLVRQMVDVKAEPRAADETVLWPIR